MQNTLGNTPAAGQSPAGQRYGRWTLAAAGSAMGAALLVVGAFAPMPMQPNAQFTDARMVMVYNSTAQTAGFQFFLDGEPWKNLKVTDPNNKKILDLSSVKALKEQGLSNMTLGSGAPTTADLPIGTFFSRFPAGNYEFKGSTIESKGIDGVAEFTHILPAAPVIVTPVADSDQDPGNTVIDWNVVPDPGGSTIQSYQVTVTQVLDVHPKRTFTVVVPASVTAVTVPAAFLIDGQDYTFEVRAIEEGGNQTITTSTFSAAVPPPPPPP